MGRGRGTAAAVALGLVACSGGGGDPATRPSATPASASPVAVAASDQPYCAALAEFRDAIQDFGGAFTSALEAAAQPSAAPTAEPTGDGAFAASFAAVTASTAGAEDAAPPPLRMFWTATRAFYEGALPAVQAADEPLLAFQEAAAGLDEQQQRELAAAQAALNADTPARCGLEIRF